MILLVIYLVGYLLRKYTPWKVTFYIPGLLVLVVSLVSLVYGLITGVRGDAGLWALFVAFMFLLGSGIMLLFQWYHSKALDSPHYGDMIHSIQLVLLPLLSARAVFYEVTYGNFIRQVGPNSYTDMNQYLIYFVAIGISVCCYLLFSFLSLKKGLDTKFPYYVFFGIWTIITILEFVTNGFTLHISSSGFDLFSWVSVIAVMYVMVHTTHRLIITIRQTNLTKKLG